MLSTARHTNLSDRLIARAGRIVEEVVGLNV